MSPESRVVVAAESGIAIRSARDITDAIGGCFGARGLILTETDLAPAFFDLHSGLAGELLQKFTNYRMRVAIVLPDPGAYGPRWKELAHEHRSHTLIRFVPTRGEADAWFELG
jgi:hypothetical protein